MLSHDLLRSLVVEDFELEALSEVSDNPLLLAETLLVQRRGLLRALEFLRLVLHISSRSVDPFSCFREQKFGGGQFQLRVGKLFRDPLDVGVRKRGELFQAWGEIFDCWVRH